MFWSELIPCILFLGLLLLVPKSPRWLIMKNRKEEARKVLEIIHDKDLVEIEMKEIAASIDNSDNPGFLILLKKAFLPIVLIGTALSMLQQLTGINAVLYYGADIFEKALGFDQEDVLGRQILLAGVNLVCTFIAMYTVDKLGRKPLIYIGSFGMIVGFLLLGLSLMFQQIGLLSLIGILVFIGSFALSMGPIVWVLLAEIFPNKIRSLAMSVAVAAQWAMNFIVSQTFPVVMDSDTNKDHFWNGSLPYFIFMVFIVLIIVLTKKYIPETKGKSLEELENVWNYK